MGFDPAPGVLGSVETLAENFETVASRLSQAHAVLIWIGRSDGVWDGDAADKFQSTVGELPGYLEKAKTSLGSAATTLAQWSSDLAAMKTTAAGYEAQAAHALERLKRAESNPDLGLAGQFFSDETSLQQEAYSKVPS